MVRAAGAGAGILLGGAAEMGAAPLAKAGTSSGFRWCSRCQSMWFAEGGDNGHCPVSHWWDHSHYQDGSATHWFVDEQYAVGQDRFGMLALKWCLTCKAAYLHGPGVCPHNAAGHTPSARTYRIETDLQPPLSSFPKQSGWSRCTRCLGLYYQPNWLYCHCPVDGDPHLGASVNTGSGWRYEGYFPRFH